MNESEKILKSMRSLKDWMMRHLSDFDWLLKQRDDIEWYRNQTAQLIKKVEVLERKIDELRKDNMR